MNDLVPAIRSLARSPLFAVVVAATLAVGMGASIAIFSATHALFLRPLPYHEPGQLISIRTMVKRDSWERRGFSVPDFRDYRDQARKTLVYIAGFSPTSLSLDTGRDPETVRAETVSDNYFATLGISPAMGRGFLTEEDSAADTSKVALISNGLWRRRFAADPAILGKAVRLNEHSFSIIGVLPDDFHGLSGRADVWVTLHQLGSITNPRLATSRGSRWHNALGRLQPGATLEQAQAELSGVGTALAAQFPDSNTSYSADATPLREELFGDLRQPLGLLLGAVGLVLLITCVNVSNLLLVRLNARKREIAIRIGLGASRLVVSRFLLTETGVLALLGGGLGCVVAAWLTNLLAAINPVDLPLFAQPRLDAPVLGFAAILVAVCTFVIGLVPLLVAGRSHHNASLKDPGRSASTHPGAQRLGAGLVAAEVALSLALLIGAGLLLRSFANLADLPTGFRTSDLTVASIAPPVERYDPARAAAFRRDLLDRLEALPGVTAAALASDTPLDGNSGASFMTLEGASPVAAENEARVYRHSVTADFFRTAGIPLLFGETFRPEADESRDPVVIVSAALARRYGPGQTALGRRILFGRAGPDRRFATIVGVVADTKYRGIPENPTNDPDAYFPFDQVPSTITNILVHREGLDAPIASEIGSVVAGLDPLLPVSEVTTMDARVESVLASQRSTATTMGVFAGTSLLLAALGLYGVVSFTVGQRSKEIGVRMALGAQPRDIAIQVLGATARIVAVGSIVGLALAMGLGRAAASLLFNVPIVDPLIYGGACASLAAVALLAAWLPARRAAKVDPMLALRLD